MMVSQLGKDIMSAHEKRLGSASWYLHASISTESQTSFVMQQLERSQDPPSSIT